MAWQNLADRLSRARPALLLKQRRQVLRQAGQRLQEQARHRLRESRNRFQTLAARLRLLGPEQVLGRGYSITRDAQSGAVLRAAAAARAGQRLKTRLKVGEIASVVEEAG